MKIHCLDMKIVFGWLLVAAASSTIDAVLLGDEQYANQEGGRFWAFHSKGISIVNGDTCEVEHEVHKDYFGHPIQNHQWYNGVYMENSTSTESSGYIFILSDKPQVESVGDGVDVGNSGELMVLTTNPKYYEQESDGTGGPIRWRIPLLNNNDDNGDENSLSTTSASSLSTYAIHTIQHFWIIDDQSHAMILPLRRFTSDNIHQPKKHLTGMHIHFDVKSNSSSINNNNNPAQGGHPQGSSGSQPQPGNGTNGQANDGGQGNNNNQGGNNSGGNNSAGTNDTGGSGAGNNNAGGNNTGGGAGGNNNAGTNDSGGSGAGNDNAGANNAGGGEGGSNDAGTNNSGGSGAGGNNGGGAGAGNAAGGGNGGGGEQGQGGDGNTRLLRQYRILEGDTSDTGSGGAGGGEGNASSAAGNAGGGGGGNNQTNIDGNGGGGNENAGGNGGGNGGTHNNNGNGGNANHNHGGNGNHHNHGGNGNHHSKNKGKEVTPHNGHNGGILLWDEDEYIKHHGYISFGHPEEKMLHIVNLGTHVVMGQYDYSGEVEEWECRNGIGSMAYSTRNQHLFMECPGPGGGNNGEGLILELSLAKPNVPQFVAKHDEGGVSGHLQEVMDGKYVIAINKHLNTLHVFESKGNGEKSWKMSKDYEVTIEGHPDKASFYFEGGEEEEEDIDSAVLCMPLTENVNSNNINHQDEVVCDGFTDCGPPSNHRDEKAGMCLWNEDSSTSTSTNSSSFVSLLRANFDNDHKKVQNGRAPFHDLCKRCKHKDNYGDDGMCVCSPQCGSCAPVEVDKDTMKRTGVRCIALKDVLSNKNKHKKTKKVVLVEGAGAVQQPPDGGSGKECGYKAGGAFRSSTRGGKYHVSVAHYPQNSLQVVDMSTQDLHCQVELSGRPDRVIYIPPQPDQELSHDLVQSPGPGQIAFIAIASLVGVMTLWCCYRCMCGRRQRSLKDQTGRISDTRYNMDGSPRFSEHSGHSSDSSSPSSSRSKFRDVELTTSPRRGDASLPESPYLGEPAVMREVDATSDDVFIFAPADPTNPSDWSTDESPADRQLPDVS